MHKKRQILHSELDFRPVQIITGHVIYKTPNKYWPDKNGLGVFRKPVENCEDDIS